MSRRRHTPEQTIRKLAEGQKLLAGETSVEEVCRQFGIAESTGWSAEGRRCGAPLLLVMSRGLGDTDGGHPDGALTRNPRQPWSRRVGRVLADHGSGG